MDAYVAAGMVYFGLASNTPAAIIEFLLNTVDDDARYAIFMKKLKEYKTFAGYDRASHQSIVLTFLGHWQELAANHYSDELRGRILQSFTNMLGALEQMRATSSRRIRTFTQDFLS